MQEDWNYMKCSLIPRFSRLRSGRAWERGYMKCTYHDQVSSTSHHLCWYPNQLPTELWFHLQKWELMHQHQHSLDLATFHLNFHWLHNDKTESQKQHYIPPSQMIDPTDVKAKMTWIFRVDLPSWWGVSHMSSCTSCLISSSHKLNPSTVSCVSPILSSSAHNRHSPSLSERVVETHLNWWSSI